MSGQRIDDHSFWVNKKMKGSLMPEGAHTREESGEEGAGSVMKYQDTANAIRDVQSDGTGQIKKRPLKPGYRY